MKQHRLHIVILIITLLTLSPSLALAKEYEDVDFEGRAVYIEETEQHHGFFTGLGPMFGYETKALKAPAGGMTSQIGYQFNNRFSALLQVDIWYSRDDSVDYVMFPVMPTLKVTLDNEFFFFVGGGYTYLWTSSGRKIGSSVATPSRSYNGWSVFGGAGYDYWLSKKLVVSPQVGLDYTRIATSNIILPMARVNFNWMF